MIEPRHRHIVDGEGERLFHEPPERKPDRRLDRAAVCGHDDMLARLLDIDAIDRAFRAIAEIHETLAIRRRLVDYGEPVTARWLTCPECRAARALQSPEILFGERGLLDQRVGFWKSRSPDRLC